MNFFSKCTPLKVETHEALLFLRENNIVRAAKLIRARYDGVLMVDGESYMDTVTIDRIVVVDISEG